MFSFRAIDMALAVEVAVDISRGSPGAYVANPAAAGTK